jgi:site-specific DNA-methyltransferase (adenine-specific)
MGGVVLDPFNGTGTTGVVAIQNNRKYVGIDLSKEYIAMATRRLEKESQQYSLFDMQ